MTAPELKPCPFCGGLPEGPADATRILGIWRIVHRGCCALPGVSVERPTREAAVAAWNTRADLPPSLSAALALPEIAALVEAAQRLSKESGRIGPVLGEAIDALGMGDKYGIATANLWRKCLNECTAALAALQEKP
jgi:Lar family restriction alleviation protein